MSRRAWVRGVVSTPGVPGLPSPKRGRSSFRPVRASGLHGNRAPSKPAAQARESGPPAHPAVPSRTGCVPFSPPLASRHAHAGAQFSTDKPSSKIRDGSEFLCRNDRRLHPSQTRRADSLARASGFYGSGGIQARSLPKPAPQAREFGPPAHPVPNTTGCVPFQRFERFDEPEDCSCDC